jgi:5'-phosphate synthase pdxT subunit
VLPGGESTTLSLLLEASGLFDALARALAEGLPAFGTCAGLVLLSEQVRDGRPDQRSFGVLDCVVRRNGYGRQVESFQTVVPPRDLADALGPDHGGMPAIFIRAPVVEKVGPEVEVLATVARGPGEAPSPVVLRHNTVLACAFHPELSDDRRLHRLFGSMVARNAARTSSVGGTSGIVR